MRRSLVGLGRFCDVFFGMNLPHIGDQLDSVTLNHDIAVICYSESTTVILKEPQRLKDLPIAPALPLQVKSVHAIQTLPADPSVAEAPSG